MTKALVKRKLQIAKELVDALHMAKDYVWWVHKHLEPLQVHNRPEEDFRKIERLLSKWYDAV